MDQQPLRGGLPSTPKSWVVNLSAQRTLSLALIVDCDSLLRLCSLGRNHLYTGASPKDGVAAFKLKFMRFFQVLLLLLLEHPDPRSPRLGPQRPPARPAPSLFHRLVSPKPQLRAARKAEIKGESRSCIFIFSLLEGD